jgi:hypothetical protein
MGYVFEGLMASIQVNPQAAPVLHLLPTLRAGKWTLIISMNVTHMYLEVELVSEAP